MHKKQNKQALFFPEKPGSKDNAYSCGFSDSASFYRQFQVYCHEAPSSFRKKEIDIIIVNCKERPGFQKRSGAFILKDSSCVITAQDEDMRILFPIQFFQVSQHHRLLGCNAAGGEILP